MDGSRLLRSSSEHLPPPGGHVKKVPGVINSGTPKVGRESYPRYLIGDPLILKTGRPARHPISPGHSIAATRSALARSALPRERVRSLAHSGSGAYDGLYAVGESDALPPVS